MSKLRDRIKNGDDAAYTGEKTNTMSQLGVVNENSLRSYKINQLQCLFHNELVQFGMEMIDSQNAPCHGINKEIFKFDFGFYSTK